jgi:hypothetical protein
MEGRAAQPTGADARHARVPGAGAAAAGAVRRGCAGHDRPGNSLLGVAGDISADAMVAKLEKEIGGWAAGRAERPDLGGQTRITSPAW